MSAFNWNFIYYTFLTIIVIGTIRLGGTISLRYYTISHLYYRQIVQNLEIGLFEFCSLGTFMFLLKVTIHTIHTYRTKRYIYI